LATKQEKLDLLRAVPLFSDLSKTDLERILSTAKEVLHNAGESIVIEGRGGVGFHLVIDGQANVIRGGRIAAKLSPGEFFGEMALVDDAPRSASVIADTDLTTVVISKWEFRPLVKSHPEMAWKLIEHLVDRVREEQSGRDALIR
jgi:CRP/FNR family transcriptional regulator